MLDGYHITTYAIMLAVISFGGFVVENIWLALTKGFIDNRNMCAPFLIGYGMLVLGFYFLFGTPQKVKFFGKVLPIVNRMLRFLLYFIIAFLVVSICEIFLGTIAEWICKVEVWNYTRLPLHFTKYTSVPTSTGFALIIMVVMHKLFFPIMNAIEGLDESVAGVLAVGLLSVMVVDFCINAVRLAITNQLTPMWRIDMKWDKAKKAECERFEC